MVEKNKVLSDAAVTLNKADQPWEVVVKGDAIIATWRWMDATFFGINEVNDEIKDFTYTVTLNDKGKYKEVDYKAEKTNTISMKDGKIGFGTSSSSFKGKTVGKSINIGIGRDNKTGEIGIIKSKFDTATIKKPIREYLEKCGWKKAGLFG